MIIRLNIDMLSIAMHRNIDALVSAKQRPDANIGEEADRLWAEIIDRYFLFERVEVEV